MVREQLEVLSLQVGARQLHRPYDGQTFLFANRIMFLGGGQGAAQEADTVATSILLLLHQGTSDLLISSVSVDTKVRSARGKRNIGDFVNASFSNAKARACSSVSEDMSAGSPSWSSLCCGAAVRAKFGTNRQ